MRTCTACNFTNGLSAQFCIKCGHKLFESSNNNANYIGNTGPYFLMLYGGIIICFIGGMFLAENKDAGIITIIVGAMAVLVAIIDYFVLFYQVWRFIINEAQINHLITSIKTPGKAVGYLFIPFYNLYWIFQAFGKLPKDFNYLLKAKGSDKTMSEGLGLVIPILIIISLFPFIIGYVSSFINILILYPIFISQAVRLCKNYKNFKFTHM